MWTLDKKVETPDLKLHYC